MNIDLDQIRNLLNVAKEKGMEYAEVAMDKTKDAAKLAKLSVSLAAEKEAMKKSFTELGKTFYEEHRADAEGLYAQLCEEIDAAGVRVADLQREVDALKAAIGNTQGADFEEVVADQEADITVEVVEEPKEEEHSEE